MLFILDFRSLLIEGKRLCLNEREFESELIPHDCVASNKMTLTF